MADQDQTRKAIVPDQEDTKPHARLPDDSTEDYLSPPSRHLEAPPDAFPGYTLLETLGQGGMGVVYKARQEGLNRLVALKVVLGGRRVGPKEMIRFLAEAEAVAAIRHPNVVQVHEYGEVEGRPFLAMEYLRGGSLSDRLKVEGRLVPKAAAGVLAKLARAVQAAHDEGIVHRDLKPANVLFDDHDEPKVTDFGLAKRGKGADLTRTEAVMGTPAYMSPEQAQGKSKFVGPAADIYALGVILYECLTRRRPFRHDDPHILLRKVIEDDPEFPSKHAPGLPRDLELITLKCLAKEPANRYSTASALAEDLAHFVAGEPVSVREAGVAERAWKWARRKPVLATAYALTTAVLVLLAFGASVAVLWRQAEGARSVAEVAQQGEKKARKAADEARSDVEILRENTARLDHGSTMRVAHQTWRDNNRLSALAILDGTRADLRGWEWKYLQRLCQVGFVQLKGTSHNLVSVAWSPDGLRIAGANYDMTAQVWDSRTGAEKLLLKGHKDRVDWVAWSPDGSQLATACGGDKTVRVWDPGSGAEILGLKDFHYYSSSTNHSRLVKSVAWCPKGSRIAIRTTDNVRVWDTRSNAEVHSFKVERSPEIQIEWSPDGSRIVTENGDSLPRVWNAETGAEVIKLACRDIGHVTSVSWSPDSSRIATSEQLYKVRVWDSRSGALAFTLQNPTGNVTSVSWSSDGSQLATVCAFESKGSSRDGSARIWDARTGVEILGLQGNVEPMFMASWSPDGSEIATESMSDRTARIWNAKTGTETLTVEGIPPTWSPDGSRLATASSGRIWNVRPGDEALMLKGHTSVVNSVCWSPDGSRLATASRDKTARVWDAETGAEELAFTGHAGAVTSVSWRPDGWRIATASGDKTVKVWDPETGDVTLNIDCGKEDRGEPVSSASWSPDGLHLAFAGVNRAPSAWVWDAKTGVEARASRPYGFANWTSASWSPDGSRIATSGKSNRYDTSAVFDARYGDLLINFRGQANVSSVSWSPDGSRIAAASLDNTARVWFLNTGGEDHTLSLKGHTGFEAIRREHVDSKRLIGSLVFKGHTGSVTSVCWSPDGSRIATASVDNTARVWDSRSGAEVLTLKGHDRPLTSVSWSPDGSRIATASADNTVRIWDNRAAPELRSAGRP